MDSALLLYASLFIASDYNFEGESTVETLDSYLSSFKNHSFRRVLAPTFLLSPIFYSQLSKYDLTAAYLTTDAHFWMCSTNTCWMGGESGQSFECVAPNEDLGTGVRSGVLCPSAKQPEWRGSRERRGVCWW